MLAMAAVQAPPKPANFTYYFGDTANRTQWPMYVVTRRLQYSRVGTVGIPTKLYWYRVHQIHKYWVWTASEVWAR